MFQRNSFIPLFLCFFTCYSFAMAQKSNPLEKKTDNLVEAIHRREIPVDFQCSDGRTALSYASGLGFIGYVKYLLEKGASPSLFDRKGQIPLHWAAFWGQDKIVRLLLEKNRLLVDARDNDGMTPLHNACTKGHYSVADILLEYGADVNAKDGLRCRSPLNWVVRMAEGSEEKNGQLIPESKAVPLIELLFQKGADIRSKDSGRWDALAWASRNSQNGILKLLDKLDGYSLDVPNKQSGVSNCPQQ